MEPMLDVSNLSFDYLSASSCLPVIDNISFQAFEGDFISIVGPSGCGKDNGNYRKYRLRKINAS